MVGVGKTYRPRTSAVKVYDRAYEAYVEKAKALGGE
jgi:hypothetical protein